MEIPRTVTCARGIMAGRRLALRPKGTWHHRSTVLSPELEPYFLFDLEDVADHLRHASSVQGLADIGEARYGLRIDGSAGDVTSATGG